jgi:hypothetical protein
MKRTPVEDETAKVGPKSKRADYLDSQNTSMNEPINEMGEFEDEWEDEMEEEDIIGDEQVIESDDSKIPEPGMCIQRVQISLTHIS